MKSSESPRRVDSEGLEVALGANTMMPQIDTEQPVLGAIAEFRDCLNRLIDEQLSILANRCNDFDPETDSYRGSASESTFAPPAITPSSSHDSPEQKSRRAAPSTPKGRTEPVSSDKPTDLVGEQVATAGEEATVSSDQRDPRQRLDALARLLDKRAKQSGTNSSGNGPRHNDK